MRKRKLRALKKLPFVPSIKKIERLDDELAKIVINTKTIRKAKVTLCWGQKNAQTNKKFGGHCKDYQKEEGTRTFVTEFPADINDKHFRVLVRDGTA